MSGSEMSSKFKNIFGMGIVDFLSAALMVAFCFPTKNRTLISRLLLCQSHSTAVLAFSKLTHGLEARATM